MGVVSPIGIGRGPFWDAMVEGRSGIGPIRRFDASELPVRITAEIHDFDPKPYVRPRKALKVMCRDAQLGVTASSLACRDAGISGGTVDPERLGVVFGADRICSELFESELSYGPCMVDGKFDFSRWGTEGLANSFPLGFLKVLPNMIASHVSISHDARGPNNTMHHAELSGLLAVGEAAGVIVRGAADAMIAGGASSQMHPLDYVNRCATGSLSRRQDDPAAAMRPFDADRDGQVWGEGAAALILEERGHAQARGAKVLAKLVGWAACCDGRVDDNGQQGIGLCRAIETSLRQAGLGSGELGHVNAHGLSTVPDDRIEARALQRAIPGVPVTAPKGNFGNLGAAGGVVEMAASVLSLEAGLVPPTLNYRRPDPECPIEMVHGRPLCPRCSSAVVVNRTSIGQAASMVLVRGN